MKQSCKILIIDDCLEDREVYKRYLLQDLQWEYTVFEAETVEAGLHLCQSMQLEIILLDYGFPDRNGLDFLNTLRTQMPEQAAKVVMIAGQGNEFVAVQAIKWGAYDYLVKHRLTSAMLRLTLHSALATTTPSASLACCPKTPPLALPPAMLVERVHIQLTLIQVATEVLKLHELPLPKKHQWCNEIDTAIDQLTKLLQEVLPDR